MHDDLFQRLRTGHGSLIVLGLADPDALAVAHEMSRCFPAVSHALSICRSLRMELLMVRLEPSSFQISCFPLGDLSELPQALDALKSLQHPTSPFDERVTWMTIPESLKEPVQSMAHARRPAARPH